jgi:NAD-dependent dihydropyrimidine dehydrogenase PreA subunit
MSDSKVLFCGCAFYGIVPDSTCGPVLAALRKADVDLIAVPDLCKLAAEKSPLMAELSRAASLTIVACQPRSIRWLFHRAGAPLDMGRVRFLNMREKTAEDILKEVLGKTLAPGDTQPEKLQPEGEWTPWFPVIDYDRCVHCGQCHNFCLFGVYSRGNDGKVEVTLPAACKTNCPACARICPEAAIIFPKYDKGPISGDDILDETAEKERIKVDVEMILGSDTYSALAERRKKRRQMRLLKETPGERVPGTADGKRDD